MSLPEPIMDKAVAGKLINSARIRQSKTWEEIAAAIGKPEVWTVSACLGKFPVDAQSAAKITELLNLPPEVAEALEAQPARVANPELLTDPTVYRFVEAINVHGEALKELIHEKFGDGIMSAINFQVDLQRVPDPAGDRVVVTFNGKFLDYNW